MSRFEQRLLLGLTLLIIALAALEASRPKSIDWSPSYSRHHRKPYGGELVYDRLRDLFPQVRTVNEPLEQTAAKRARLLDMEGEPVNHIFINGVFALDPFATERLLALVRQGDHLFIAAEGIRGAIADTLHLDMDRLHWLGDDTSDIRFIGEHRIAEGVFHYARNFPGAYFSRYDSSRAQVLAVDGASHPVLLKMAWGKGHIVLCSAPRAFTNYNLLKNKNATFMAGALSALPPDPVWWDEFYKVGHAENSSFVRFLMKEPALRWAWFISLTLLGLYMIVYVRREQRPIPVVLPLRNATRDLAHTIGRLYWHKGDHLGIARKMIAHFKDEVRIRTYLRRFEYDDATYGHLATKTGRAREEIRDRLSALQRKEHGAHITESDLLDLSNELHELRQLIR